MEDMRLDISKVISMCADGASVMQGRHKGALTLLKRDVRKSRDATVREIIKKSAFPRAQSDFSGLRGVIGVHCVCHRFALVLTDAIKRECIPEIVKLLMRDVHKCFSKGGLRKKKPTRFFGGAQQKKATKRQGPALDPDDALHAAYQKEQERYTIPREVTLTRWLGCLQAVSCVTSSLEVYRELFTWEAGKLTEELHHERATPKKRSPPP
jgi:hypothetical protein